MLYRNTAMLGLTSELPALAAAQTSQLHWAVGTYPAGESSLDKHVHFYCLVFLHLKSSWFGVFFCDEPSHKPVQRRGISWVLVNIEVWA